MIEIELFDKLLHANHFTILDSYVKANSVLNGSNTALCSIKKKVINNYTAEGRAEIHKMLETVNIMILHYMMRNPILNRSIEYNDNRLSLYCASHGKCSITGKILEIGNIHCHHKIPYSISHDDSYGNLILICQEAHILIHAVNSEVIQHYKSLLNLNAQQIGKINKLRKLLNLADI